MKCHSSGYRYAWDFLRGCAFSNLVSRPVHHPEHGFQPAQIVSADRAKVEGTELGCAGLDDTREDRITTVRTIPTEGAELTRDESTGLTQESMTYRKRGTSEWGAERVRAVCERVVKGADGACRAPDESRP